MRNLFFIVSLVILAGCAKLQLNFPAESENNINLNTLLTINSVSDTIFLQDFIFDTNQIDSVTCQNLELNLSSDKKILTINIDEINSRFFDLKLWVEGVPYSVPCRKSDKSPFTFTYNPQGEKLVRVQIAGQMNDWTASATPDLQLNSDGLYEVELNLSPGNYLYQMLIDGEQNHDANNPDKVDNGYGKFNSILQVDGATDKYPLITTDNYSKNKIRLLVENDFEECFVYWQNYQLPASFIKTKNKIQNLTQLEITIPDEAKKLDRSFIRVWVSNKYGVSNDALIALEKGRVLENANQLTRKDNHAKIIYFILADRFKNGKTDNDSPMNRPDVHPKVDFFGGDIVGIEQVIESGYFDKLGVNTLWISPLNQNPEEPYAYLPSVPTKFAGYHGYWPISMSKVDHRFGTNNELKQMVKTAHKHEINILLDYVAHHLHELHPLYKEHPEYFTSLYLPDGTMNTEKWDEHRLTTWFDTFMPTFDMFNPKVVEMMSDSALFWINEFGIDGFRHDACKHVKNDFWRALTYKIKQENKGKNLYQIGETYGSPDLISSYLTTGMLDGQFDFNVYEDANASFAGVSEPSLVRLNKVLQGSFRTYGTHNLMGYISGNHDKARFMALASGDLEFGEDSKAAGWEREIGITDSIAYDKMALMQTFILTIPGVPVIFYGDEIGMTGANDPDCRRMMKFENLADRESKLLAKTSILGQLRKNNPVLIYGDFINLQNEAESWIYARKYFDKTAIVIINNSNKAKDFEVDIPFSLKGKVKANFGNNFSLKNNHLKINLPPYSSEVLL